jgi:hypothetical protein
MNAVELEQELWAINDELVKAGIKPREYPTMHEAAAELVKRYKAAQQSVQSDGVCPRVDHHKAWRGSLAACPDCGETL